MHPSATDAIRAAIQLRYRLMPYLYTRMWAGAARGEPVVRPVGFDFPDCWALDDAFMLGPDLLVAPVLEPGATTRQIILPPGRWYEFATDRPCEGAVDVAALPGKLPVFVRGGAILPLSRRFDLAGPDSERELAIYGPEAAGELYEDDGTTSRWRTDCFHATFRASGGILSGTVQAHGYRPAYGKIPVRVVDGPAPTLTDWAGPQLVG
jgi:alpha-glucosidase